MADGECSLLGHDMSCLHAAIHFQRICVMHLPRWPCCGSLVAFDCLLRTGELIKLQGWGHHLQYCIYIYIYILSQALTYQIPGERNALASQTVSPLNSSSWCGCLLVMFSTCSQVMALLFVHLLLLVHHSESWFIGYL